MSTAAITLKQENAKYRGTAGVSRNNRRYGFRPAFLDEQKQVVYLSRFADGRPAPIHLLDGLPDDLVLSRSTCGRAVELKPHVVSGFVLAGRFYTRAAAAQKISGFN
jgi:hypothetical protein